MTIRTAALLASIAIAPAAAFAQVGSGGVINDGNAQFRIGDYLGGGGGNGPQANFTVGGSGNPDHLFGAWWWFRESDASREFAISNAASWEYNASFARVDYEYENFSATMTWAVLGLGDGFGVLTQTLTIRNRTNNPLMMSVFNYNDVDAVGSAGGDSAVLTGPNVMEITDAARPDWTLTYEGTSAFASAFWPGVRDRLTDEDVDNLTGTGLPGGPGDLDMGFQWDVMLDANDAFTASSTLTIVPAPGAAALAGLGGLAMLRRRR